jgi:hypothetical protein
MPISEEDKREQDHQQEQSDQLDEMLEEEYEAVESIDNGGDNGGDNEEEKSDEDQETQESGEGEEGEDGGIDDEVAEDEHDEEDKDEAELDDGKVADKVEELDEEVESSPSLIEQLEEVSARVNQGRVNLNAEEKTPKQIEKENEEYEENEDKEKETLRDLLPFVSDEVYEKALSDPKELNGLMNQVYNKAVADMTRSLPGLMSNMITQQTQMQRLADDFYKENEDLVPMKNYVGFVANEIAGKHPEWAYDKLFNEVAIEVRRRLKVGKKAKKAEDGARTKRPAFAKKPKGRANVESKLSDLERDLVELM